MDVADRCVSIFFFEFLSHQVYVSSPKIEVMSNIGTQRGSEVCAESQVTSDVFVIV